MDTMIRTFFRHLLESIKSLKRNGWMTVASVSAVTITLTLVGVFMAVIMIMAAAVFVFMAMFVHMFVFLDAAYEHVHARSLYAAF